MRAKDFLAEASITALSFDVIDDAAMVNYLKQNCKTAISSEAYLKNPLYKGWNKKSIPNGYVVADSSLSKRKSENTVNFYTLLMDNSSFMEGYPKRSTSFICANDMTIASYYSSWGYPHVVIPTDSVSRIAVCPTRDIWEVRINAPSWFPKELSFYDIIDVNDALTDIFKIPNTTSWSEFKQNLSHSKSLAAMLEKAGKSVDEFIFDLQYMLSPKQAKFTTTTIEGVGSLPKGRECWFTGKAVFIPADFFNVIKKNL